MAEQGQYSIEKILKDFRNLDSAKELFSELNYDIARDSLSRRDWGKIDLVELRLKKAASLE